ncbi:MAG: adenosine deaminase [Spirochaetales bacterium]
MKKTDFYEFLRKIPKAEIHLHAEATISRATVKTLLDRSPDQKMNPVTVESLYQFNTLKGFLASFLFVQSLIKELPDLENMFEDAATYLRENNIVYAELFFSPTGLIKKGLKFADMIEVIQKAINRIQKRDKLTIKLIIDVSRMFGVENAQNNLELTLSHKSPMVIGVGLGGDEEFGPAKVFEDVFAVAKAKGLHVVAHAGEVVGPESIWDALQKLQVERIGHGLSATQDPKLVKFLADKQIPIEICLTSNVITQKYVTKAEDHPVRHLFDQGVLTVINTDDPSFFDVSLIDEFWTLHTKLNFTMDEIKKLVLNGFQASFLTMKEKTAYFAQVEAAWATASK